MSRASHTRGDRRRTVLAIVLGDAIGLVAGLIIGFIVVGDDVAGGQTTALLWGAGGLVIGGAIGFAVSRLIGPPERAVTDPELTGEMRRIHSEHTVRSQIAGYLRGGNT